MPHRSSPRPLFWCLIVLALPALGQRPGRSGIGLKAGAQWCSHRAEGLTYQPVPGAAAGMYFPLWCGARFELQPELLISYQGADLVNPEQETRASRLLYVQLPISAKLYVSNAVNAQFGAQGAKLLSVRVDGDAVTDRYEPLDFGLTVGLGIDLSSGFDMTARYYSGRTTIAPAEDNHFTTNRVLQLSAGYRIARLSHARHRRGPG